jgi:serine phosphatase RsbU (regulator of sigma subunit)
MVAGLDAGADAAVAHPVEPGVCAAQLRALARVRATAARVAARAAEARLIGDQLKRALTQLDREGEMARRVRAGFLPPALPEVAGVRFHAYHRARARAGGDFYDVRRLDEGHVGFFVGEVVGTGAAGGALLGAYVQQSVTPKEITGNGYRLVPPEEVLSGVNRRLVELHTDDLPVVAMLCGLLNARTGALSLARAGLPSPVYIPADGPVEVWAVPGPFLGTAGATYPPLTAALRPGDRLLIGTDGTRPDGDPGPGSPDHLVAAAAKHRGATGPAFVGRGRGGVARARPPRRRLHPAGN